jgi:hypothetical protein
MSHQLELELDTLDPDILLSEPEMDSDKEVTQRLLDGRQSSSYTDLPSTTAGKDGSRIGTLETVAERYRLIYEKAQYECRHVFEPTFAWTREEERAIVRKIDWHVCLWAVCFSYSLAATRRLIYCSV